MENHLTDEHGNEIYKACPWDGCATPVQLDGWCRCRNGHTFDPQDAADYWETKG